MRRIKNLLSISLICIGIELFVSACINKDYDLSDVDATIGVGRDSLVLPSNNSTSEIMLDSILDLNNSNFITIAENGDYMFNISDEASQFYSACFDIIKSDAQGPLNGELSFKVPSLSGNSETFSFEGKILNFDYTFTGIPYWIADVQYVGVEGSITLTLTFNKKFKNALRKIQKLDIKVPDCLDLSSATLNGNEIALSSNHSVSLKDLSTAEDAILIFHVKGFNFNTSGDWGDLTFARGKTIHLSGGILLEGTVNNSDFNEIPSGDITIIGSATVSKAKMTEVIGKFSKKVTFDDQGRVKLNNIPDFLKEGQVIVDLYDPHVNLNFTSDMPMDVFYDATLVSKDASGNEMAKIVIPQFRIKRTGETVISIRKREGIVTGDTTIVVAPDLPNLFRKIPASIELSRITAISDDSDFYSIELGRDYAVSGSYSITTPLALDSDAVISYHKTFDGWNNDIKNLRFKEEVINGVSIPQGSIKADLDVENKIPAYLTVHAYGVDINGDSISTDRLQIYVEKTIAASPNGQPTTTHETITMTPTDNAVFKELNGIKLAFVGAASDGVSPVTGVTFNAYNQTLKLNNIRIVVYGKVIADLN
ncbi:MAG: hypothetical protein K6C10_10335 [Prevotella sp.]|nr:hypothetical protein [Prevotella sp.]